MCVRNLSTFAPSSLRRAWGLHPPSQVGTRNRAALLRTRQAGTCAPLGAQFVLTDIGHSPLEAANCLPPEIRDGQPGFP